jgi:hypothetical protein
MHIHGGIKKFKNFWVFAVFVSLCACVYLQVCGECVNRDLFWCVHTFSVQIVWKTPDSIWFGKLCHFRNQYTKSHTQFGERVNIKVLYMTGHNILTILTRQWVKLQCTVGVAFQRGLIKTG